MNSKILLALFCALAFTQSKAQNFYVAMNGSNGNVGDLTHPFATIQKGIDAASTAGSTVYVMAGTYASGITFQSYSGTGAMPINLRNYNNDVVYVDAGGTSAGAFTAMLSLENVSNIVIDGINFQNAVNNQVKGILVKAGCSNITVRNCTFSNIHFSNNASDIPGTGQGSSPFIVYGTSATAAIANIRITKSKVFNCRTGQSEGITFTGNVDGFTVDSNVIYNIGNMGIDAAGHRGVSPTLALDQARNGIIRRNTLYNCVSPVGDNGQIYVDGGKNIIIENNTCYNGTIGIVAGCEILNTSANGVTIRNNLVYHNRYTGIQVGTADTNTVNKKVVGTYVSGNTCYDNDYNSGYAGQLLVKYADSTTVMNNVFASPTNPVVFTYYYSTGLGNKSDYNLYWTPLGSSSTFNYYRNPLNGYYNFSSYQSGTGQDAHGKCANPLFVNAAGNDYHLQNGSPAISAGNPSYIGTGETDMDGMPRVVGTIDCGADETSYPTTAVGQQSASAVSVYPNPTTGRIVVKGLQDGAAINLMDLQGRPLLATNETKNECSLDMTDYPAGVYFLIVRRGLSIQFRAPIVKH